jgi:hypothetical protein
MDNGRSMRAVKDSLAAPLKRDIENWKGLVRRAQSRINQATLKEIGESRLDALLCSSDARSKGQSWPPVKRGIENSKGLVGHAQWQTI